MFATSQITPAQWRTLIAAMLGWMLDALDVMLYSFALLSMQKEFGLSGAQAYPADNPQGHGPQSVAYVRVGGQQCTYNVWSRISRTHLETLLDNLRLLR